MILLPGFSFITFPESIDWVRMLQFFIVLYFSISFHECAHAWAANRNGDDTARLMGRMTLNPIPHIDMIGTVIIPVIGYLTSGFALIGWGKPVPVNSLRFKNYRRGEIETSLAGPLSNLILVFGGLLLMRLALKISPVPAGAERNPVLINLLGQIAILNMVLCLFNLIPIHPLDGSHVLKHYLSREALESYDRIIGPYGWIILLLLLNLGALGFIFNIGFRIMLLFVNDVHVWIRVLAR
jgi:Zn-dependent protease